MTHSKGISWIDDCRIPFVDEKDKDKNTNGLSRFTEYRGKRLELGYGFNGGETYNINTQGRFPANILVSDDMLNDGSTTKGSGHKIPKRTNNSKNVLDLKTYHREAAYEDKGTNSRYYDIDKWFDKIINYE